MSPQRIREMLQQTLIDYRLSRSEKETLGRIFEHIEPGPRELGLYRSIAFDLARDALSDGNVAQIVDWLEDINKLLADKAGANDEPPEAEAVFSPGDDCPKRIAGLLQRCRSTADICVFTITDDRISDAIVAAHLRKVTVRVITDDEKAADRGSDIARLADAGIPVRIDRTPYHMHHKFAIFDGRLLLTGSYNWTRSAAAVNEENFIITGDGRLIDPFAQLFNSLWNQFA